MEARSALSLSAAAVCLEQSHRALLQEARQHLRLRRALRELLLRIDDASRVVDRESERLDALLGETQSCFIRQAMMDLRDAAASAEKLAR
jgi:hypothetical protein